MIRAVLVLLLGMSVTAWAGDAPFGGVPWAVPGTIEAEDYDEGGRNSGYFDTTTGNKGGQYRSDDVDIWLSTSQGHYVGAMATREWLEYTVDNASTDTYSVTFNIATPKDNRKLHIEVDGVNVSGPITVPNTGGWQSWNEFTVSGVQLSTGLHEVRLVVDAGGLNLAWFEFTTNGEPPPPPPPPPPPNGGFTPHPSITYVGRSYGSAWCDLDGDGLPEIWDTRHLGEDVIYKWHGEQLETIRVPEISKDTHSASCVDFDNDGDLDVFIASGGNRGKDTGTQPNLLYRNDGGLVFNEIGNVVGLRYQLSRGRHAVWMSLDDDGLTDVVLLVRKRDDGTYPNTMLVQDGGGFVRLRDIAQTQFQHGGLIWAGGNPYLILTHTNFPGSVWKPAANSWTNASLPGWSYGKFNFTQDYELIDNGALGADIVLCRRNGLGIWISEQQNGTFRAPRQIQSGSCQAMAVADFDNDGDQEFWSGNFNTVTVGDYNGDGCLDLFTTKGQASDGAHQLLVNSQCGNRNWVRIRLRGTTSPADAFGAEVILNGEQYRIHQYTTRRAYHEPLVHFGLGARTNASVQVKWPSGRVSTHQLQLNRLNEVVEP